MEKELYKLLREYQHYKRMSAGFFTHLTKETGMCISDFILWLGSRDK